jgi:hypothetical protein
VNRFLFWGAASAALLVSVAATVQGLDSYKVVTPLASASASAAAAPSAAAPPSASPFDLAIASAAAAPSAAPVPEVAPVPAGNSVNLGIIMVTYQGAQNGVVGGAPRTRSKDDALALAKKLAEDAKTNFAAAVNRGDPGSDANLGRFPKGTLEANVEAVVFALPPGGISEPIDTPRGYWVAKRLE